MNKSILLICLCWSFALFLFAENWTVLVYMAADNDLSNQALENIQQMEEAIQAPGLNLIVQADLAGSGAKRYKITHHPQPGIGSQLIGNLGSIDSGDPDTLQDFIKWGFNRYPSQRKMLILWSHADSWYNKSKYIAPDLDTGNAIGIANGQLSSALDGGPHLDILLFDACSMQSIEIAWELRHYADYIVGSADLVPVRGFPYKEMIPLFTGEPLLAATQIPELYTASYLPGTPNNPSMYYLTTTCSTIQTNLLGSFITEFKYLILNLFPYAEKLMTLRESLYEMNSGYADVDINQLLYRMYKQGILPEAADLLMQTLNNVIIAYSYTTFYPEEELRSLALWFPDIRLNFDNAWMVYIQLDFAQNQWLSLVNAAIGDDQLAPQKASLASQAQRHGILHLDLLAPQDPDSLHYYLESGHVSYYISPPAYAREFRTSFAIDKPGKAMIYAIDRAGNISEALQVDYEYKEPRESIFIRPNPIPRNDIAFLDWYFAEAADSWLTLRLYNIKGKEIISKRIYSQTDTGSIRLDQLEGFTRLGRGVYIIELQSGSKRLRAKTALR